MTNNIFSIRFVILNVFWLLHLYLPHFLIVVTVHNYSEAFTANVRIFGIIKEKIKGKCFEFYCTNIYVPSFKSIIYTNIYIIYIYLYYIYTCNILYTVYMNNKDIIFWCNLSKLFTRYFEYKRDNIYTSSYSKITFIFSMYVYFKKEKE